MIALLCCVAAASAFVGPAHTIVGPAMASGKSRCIIKCNDLAWRRKQSENIGKSPEADNAGAGAAADSTEEASSAPRGVYGDGLMKAKKGQPNLSTSVDDMNFFGAVGGGTLSRASIENAQKTSSPRIDAMEALTAAIKGGNPTAESLAKIIGDAYEVGVSVTAPQMVKAAALLTQLEAAGKAPAAEEADLDPAAAAADADINQKLDQLFADEYSFPELEE